MKFLQRPGSRYSILASLIWLTMSLLAPVSARAASAISQGFQAGSSGIVSGALVSLRAGTSNTVELATVSNRSRMLGIAGTQSLIEFANGQPVRVVTGGTTPTLVSDINGVIKSGDRITASPIVGIGMKATESTMVIGSAQSDMQLASSETRDVTAQNGTHRTVHIGAVSTLVTPTYYEASTVHSKLVPSSIQDFAANLAGHQVSPIRILIAGLIIVLLFVAVAMLLYSSVRSSIISIGRNPLSERAVRRGLLEVGVTIVGVLAFTVIAVYLILTT